MKKRRIERLNSLLKEVISEVINKDVKNPDIGPFVSVTRVDISADLRHAKVYISVIGDEAEKQKTLSALNSAAGFITIHASKKVVLRYFPSLTFKLDTSVDEHLRIEKILDEIHKEETSRTKDANNNE